MKIIVRPVKQEDANDIHSFLTKEEVCSNVILLPSTRLEDCKKYLASLGEENHYYVAEIDQYNRKRVIGCASITIKSRLRQKHCAALGITVDPIYHNKGVGTALIKKLIDLADNWLMLQRMELDVLTDNHSAIRLYKKFGFVKEGTKKYALIKDGHYADLLLMARYKVV